MQVYVEGGLRSDGVDVLLEIAKLLLLLLMIIAVGIVALLLMLLLTEALQELHTL